jgi:hypothetical protein
VESIKINKLEIENVKRVKAVKIEPTKNGLTIVGGDNQQGKTSILDSIAWALGGDKYKPSIPHRESSVTPPHLNIVLSNGLVVERKGKNSDLKVIDPNGNKAGQTLLNDFVEQLALDLPKFMESSNRDKANVLLKIVGVGEQLAILEHNEKEIYQKRLTIGQIADQKAKFAKEQPYHADAPKDLVSATELINQQQEILARNGENQRKRDNKENLAKQVSLIESELADLQSRINIKQQDLSKALEDLNIANQSIADLKDESTEELQKNLENIELINVKVRANLDKDKAETDALDYKNQYDTLTAEITDVRKEKEELLTSAKLPLPDLSISDGELIYKGQKWDNMSGAEKLVVSTAIVRKLNPKCGFVLLDKLEQMDVNTLREFGKWLEQEGLQAIATRVSTGDECSIIIEDGYVKGFKEEMQAYVYK